VTVGFAPDDILSPASASNEALVIVYVGAAAIIN
jgi:hypothetical protein